METEQANSKAIKHKPQLEFYGDLGLKKKSFT
jgi:hypothetical protein